MPVRKTKKRATAKAKTKKTTKKAPAKKKTSKVKKGQAYECSLCGYRIIVDKVCGCAEEHVFICCDKPMKKKRARMAA
jgi:rubrerythrin